MSYTHAVFTSCELRQIGKYENSSGHFGYAPTETTRNRIIKELSTVMTAGRLSKDNRDIIKEVMRSESDDELAIIKAQQLISCAPEFHATGVVGKTDVERTQNLVLPTESRKPYKALIMVLLPGGAGKFSQSRKHAHH